MAKSDHGKKAVSRGVGESKRFNNPDAFPDSLDWSKLTINGEPIPEDVMGKIPYRMTDQGAAEERDRKIATGTMRPDAPRVEVLRDADDKRVDAYRDDMEYGDLIQSDDPLKLPMERHTPKGHRGLWMGAQKIKESGFVRGRIEFKPVLVKNETTGVMEQVTQNGMLLCSAPEALAKRNDEFYQGIAQSREVAAKEKVEEAGDRLVGERRLKDLARRHRTSEDLAGITVEHPEDGDDDLARHLATVDVGMGDDND